MKDFLLGFFVCVSLSLSVYTLWENHRHVLVILQPIPIYLKPEFGNITIPPPPANPPPKTAPPPPQENLKTKVLCGNQK